MKNNFNTCIVLSLISFSFLTSQVFAQELKVQKKKVVVEKKMPLSKNIYFTLQTGTKVSYPRRNIKQEGCSDLIISDTLEACQLINNWLIIGEKEEDNVARNVSIIQPNGKEFKFGNIYNFDLVRVKGNFIVVDLVTPTQRKVFIIDSRTGKLLKIFGKNVFYAVDGYGFSNNVIHIFSDKYIFFNHQTGAIDNNRGKGYYSIQNSLDDNTGIFWTQDHKGSPFALFNINTHKQIGVKDNKGKKIFHFQNIDTINCGGSLASFGDHLKLTLVDSTVAWFDKIHKKFIPFNDSDKSNIFIFDTLEAVKRCDYWGDMCYYFCRPEISHSDVE